METKQTASFIRMDQGTTAEFEHIVEQLDGVDLARFARLAPGTVWATGTQQFETERAAHTGRLVAAEVEGRAR